MANSEVTLVLTDWTKGSNGKKFDLPHIPMNSTIVEVKKSILQALDQADREPDSILLFMGNIHLEDQKLLKDYNRSNRSRLNVDVRDRFDLNLRIKTLQPAGGCVCVPLWSYLCRQTINICIPDHMRVGDLKKRIAEELDDPNRYTAQNIKLTFRRDMLLDDDKTLKEIGLQKDSTLTLLVDCCYWTKARTPAPASTAKLDEEAAVAKAEADYANGSGVHYVHDSDAEQDYPPQLQMASEKD
ncbi:hypothetical protein ACSSS7_000479 [Eimeria intestinalis]